MIHWLSVNWLGIVFDDIIRDSSNIFAQWKSRQHIRSVVISGLKNEWMVEQKNPRKGEKCEHLSGRGEKDEDGI